MSTYLPDDRYLTLVEKLARMSDHDEIKMALGEIGDIWPAYIKDDAEADGD